MANGIAADVDRADWFGEDGLETRATGILRDQGIENMDDNFPADKIVAQNFADGRVAVSRVALKTAVVIDRGQREAAQATVDADVGIIGENRDVDDLGADGRDQPGEVDLLLVCAALDPIKSSPPVAAPPTPVSLKALFLTASAAACERSSSSWRMNSESPQIKEPRIPFL